MPTAAQPQTVSLEGYAATPRPAEELNGTGTRQPPKTILDRNRDSTLSWDFSGAGDGNRTRTISLGICSVTAVRAAELAIRMPASDRCYPSFSVVNGTVILCSPGGDPSRSHLQRT